MKDLQQAATGLDRLIAKSLRQRAGDVPVIAWPLACGSAVAERTTAREFTNGILRVEVADVGWKRELQSLVPRYLATLNRYTGEKVERIEFIIRKP